MHIRKEMLPQCYSSFRSTEVRSILSEIKCILQYTFEQLYQIIYCIELLNKTIFVLFRFV